MGKRDLQDLKSLLGDLWRELSWILRIGFFGGLLAGLLLGVYLVGQVPRDEVRRGFLRLLLFFLVGLTALGGFLGLALGAAVELALKAFFDKPDEKKPKRRR